MGFNDRLVFPQPEAGPIEVERESVTDATCPRCGSEEIQRYPIGYYKGPRMVVKCQSCFHSLAVERPGPEDAWPPFKPATYDWEPSPAERVGGERRRSEHGGEPGR